MRVTHLYPLILSLVLFILAGVAYAHWHTPPSSTQQGVYEPTSSTPATDPAGAGNTTNASQGATTYTTAQIARHSGASSCWTSINGGVYDLTTWIDQHPGGPERILSLCGHDGSDAFNGQHGGQRRPEQELAGFKIGSLAQ